MGDVIGLQDRQLIENQEFVSDLARFSESLLTEKFIRRKYGNLDEASWTRLAENEDLVEKIEAEKIRRMRSGETKREKSQQLITKAPGILDSIASDVNASPRHRVDAIKTLDTFAANGPEGVPAADRFQIIIRLDADTTLQFDKSRSVDANDVDPFNTDTAPQGPFRVIAAKKEDDGNGESL